MIGKAKTQGLKKQVGFGAAGGAIGYFVGKYFDKKASYADDLYTSEYEDIRNKYQAGKVTTKDDVVKVLTQQADKSIAKNEKWWARDKARAGKKLTTKERLGETAMGATALGMVGGIAGAFASIPAQLLKIPFKKLRGVAMAGKGAIAGGALGAGFGGATM